MAKKDISPVISGMGVAMSIITSLVNAVKKLGGTGEEVHLLATPEGENLIQKFAEMIVSASSSVFRVTVDYGKSLAQMITASHFNSVNNEITEKNFPVKGTGKQEVVLELLCFKKAMSSEQVLTEMKSRKLRPPTLHIALAFVEQNPDEQRKYVIVVLGSVLWHWFGYRAVPYLLGGGGGRRLRLACFGDDWYEGCRFLAVRES